MRAKTKTALKILAVAGGVGFGLYAYASWIDYGQAKEFCDQVQVGSSLPDVTRMAQINQTKSGSRLIRDGDVLRVSFITWHTCQCDLGLKGESISWTRAWCAD